MKALLLQPWLLLRTILHVVHRTVLPVGAVVASAPVSDGTPHNYKLIFRVAAGHVCALFIDPPPPGSARPTMTATENRLCRKFVDNDDPRETRAVPVEKPACNEELSILS